MFTGELTSVKIADVMRGNNTFLYTGDESDESTWPGKLALLTESIQHLSPPLSCFHYLTLILVGIPYDGVPVEEVVTVHISATVIIALLATAGLMFTAVCLIFNFVFRKRKYNCPLLFCVLSVLN